MRSNTDGIGRRGPRRVDAVGVGSSIGRNTLWNLFGAGLPILLALVAVPVLIHSAGAESFGVLSIAWAVGRCLRWETARKMRKPTDRKSINTVMVNRRFSRSSLPFTSSTYRIEETFE